MASLVRRVAGFWPWLVDGTAEAVAFLVDRWRVRGVVRVALDAEGGGPVTGADGRVAGQVVVAEGRARVEPAAAAARLAGASVEIVCPPAWLFRRRLDPVAAEGAPFLDAFVRHQIDRLTPWRAEDVDLCVQAAPLAGSPGRIEVEIGVLPRRLTGPAVEALRACRPARLLLVATDARDGRRFAARVGDPPAARLRRLRAPVAAALVAYLLAWPALVGWAWWSAAAVSDEIAAADQVIAGRKAVLAAAARRAEAAGGEGSALLRLREQRPRAVDLIEALSAALPDSAYVTELAVENGAIRLSGVSTDTAALVPALEGSRLFGDAAFYDATTRLEGEGRGDRFHIQARVRQPAAPPPAP